MLQYFRSNQLYSGFLLIFYALLIRLPAWWMPAGELNGRDPGAGVLGEFYLRLGTNAPTVNVLLPILLIFLTALLANQLVAANGLSKRQTQLSGLSIILVGSISPALLGLHSIQPASIFLLLAVGSVFRIYQSNQPTRHTFNAGCLLGIALLFNIYFVVFLLLLIVAGLQLGSINLRMLLQFIVGCSLPLFLLATWSYWMGDLDHFREVQLSGYFGALPGKEAYWNLGGLAVLMTILSFSLFKQNANVKLLAIGGRKKMSIVYFWLLLSGIGLFLHSTFDFSAAQLMIVPLGILLSMSFARSTPANGEASHLLLLVCALGLNLYPILLG